jgi:hypothetical protein
MILSSASVGKIVFEPPYSDFKAFEPGCSTARSIIRWDADPALQALGTIEPQSRDARARNTAVRAGTGADRARASKRRIDAILAKHGVQAFADGFLRDADLGWDAEVLNSHAAQALRCSIQSVGNRAKADRQLLVANAIDQAVTANCYAALP